MNLARMRIATKAWLVLERTLSSVSGIWVVSEGCSDSPRANEAKHPAVMQRILAEQRCHASHASERSAALGSIQAAGGYLNLKVEHAQWAARLVMNDRLIGHQNGLIT